MNRPLQRELFAQRPVRSDFARRRGGDGGGPSFNPRKLLFLGFLIAVAVGGGFAVNAFMSGSNGKLEEIPTVQADMPVKERPDQPGGIDIPHQGVAVFEKLDNNAAPQQTADDGVEHLLPAPEVPKPAPAPDTTASQGGEVASPPAAQTETVTPVPEPAQAPVQEALPPAVTEAEDVPDQQSVAAAPEPKKAEPAKTEPVKAVEKKAEPKPAPVETVKKAVTVKATSKTETAKTKEDQKAETALAHLPKELFTKDNYTPEKATTSTSSTTSATASTGGKQTTVQLASLTDEAAAKKMVATLQSRYAGILGGTTLRVERADLGSKGVYYRIKSGSLSESKAKAICADITKQKKGNCIVVK